MKLQFFHFSKNMAQSRAELKKFPEVDFKISSTGITILCTRLYTPRFVPFDIKGRCECCKSDGAELDFVITIDGITIYCTRLQKPRFIPFDWPYSKFPQSCIFRVKTRAKIFNIEHESYNQENHGNQTDILNEAISTVFGNEKVSHFPSEDYPQTSNQEQISQVPEYYN